MKKKYPRDLIGYGSKNLNVKWPNNSKIALQFVLNYEEGGENSVLHGDKTSEVFLSEIIGAQPIKGRHLNMESIYEYGSRRGFWRIYDLFKQKNIKLQTIEVGLDKPEEYKRDLQAYKNQYNRKENIRIYIFGRFYQKILQNLTLGSNIESLNILIYIYIYIYIYQLKKVSIKKSNTYFDLEDTAENQSVGR